MRNICQNNVDVSEIEKLKMISLLNTEISLQYTCVVMMIGLIVVWVCLIKKNGTRLYSINAMLFFFICFFCSKISYYAEWAHVYRSCEIYQISTFKSCLLMTLPMYFFVLASILNLCHVIKKYIDI